MNILHFGDLHVWSSVPYLREAYYPKRFLGPLNLLLKRAKRFPAANREKAIQAVLDQDVDLVLFTGDFTNFSLESEFREAARLFAPLREKWGENLLAIPGNHDVYTHRSAQRKLVEKHLPWVRTDLSWSQEVAPGRHIVGVQHAVPLWLRSNGVVSEASQQALEQQFQELQTKGHRCLVMGHFAYATPDAHPETPEHKLLGDDRFAELIGGYAPDAYLHGHKHVRWAIRAPETPKTLCLNCGSVSMISSSLEKQAGFLRFTWQESGDLENLTAYTLGTNDNQWTPTPLEIP